MSPLRVFSAFVILSLAIVFGVSAQAQVLGELKGRVSDPSGAAVAGAEVTLTLTANDVAQTMKTTSAGVYDFTQLTSGIYKAQVSQVGSEVGPRRHHHDDRTTNGALGCRA